MENKGAKKSLKMKRSYSYSRLSENYLNMAYELILPIRDVTLKSFHKELKNNCKMKKGA